MDVLKPQLMWIGTRCYRVNLVTAQEYEQSEESKAYIEEDLYEEDDRELDYDIQLKEGGKLQTSFHVPSAFFAMIIGNKGATRRRLEAETKTQIIVPKQGTEGDVIVKGTSTKAVTACRQRIELIVLGARNKQHFTHFLSVPMISDEIKSNFIKFREKVLTELPSGFNLDESLFQKPEKLHLTLCMMSLMDNVDRTHAAQLLQDCRESIIELTLAEFGPIEVRLRGLQYMNDDPSAVDVLYAKVESEPLQRIADQIMEYFIANGLMQRQYGHVKLHATLINSVFNRHHRHSHGEGEEGEERRPHHNRHHRDKFDATAILREFGEFDFGAQKVTEIHLSQRFSTACNGFYEATGLVKL
ncbi:activating signal cointegrator 1 complex subunit 1 [Ochlerotatus camptorhynchus]|uniref:activating signal cointegrator 1 complex subunit 1 n=1 Tax=Ochlerotatus camptorhynchus TaxID=644619 RepID=UPI0031DC16B6